MIILEGIRRSGKSYTIDVLKRKIPSLNFYKDLGMRLIADSPVDPDVYAVGRDFAYAQFLPKLYWHEDFVDKLFFDRAYWSSYVYGQAWRNNYSKTFWKEHIKRVEDTYGMFLDRITIAFLTLVEDDFKRIEFMNRSKDQWEGLTDYRKQYELYMELLDISNAKKFEIEAFRDDEYILSTFRKIINS